MEEDVQTYPKNYRGKRSKDGLHEQSQWL